jgi:hypothetical protein
MQLDMQELEDGWCHPHQEVKFNRGLWSSLPRIVVDNQTNDFKDEKAIVVKKVGQG